MSRLLRRRSWGSRPRADPPYARWRAFAIAHPHGVQLVVERTLPGADDVTIVRDELPPGDPTTTLRLSALAREAQEDTRAERDRYEHWRSLRALAEELDGGVPDRADGYWLALDVPARYDGPAGHAAICRLDATGAVLRVASADLAAGTALDATARARDLHAVADLRSRFAELNRLG